MNTLQFASYSLQKANAEFKPTYQLQNGCSCTIGQVKEMAQTMLKATLDNNYENLNNYYETVIPKFWFAGSDSLYRNVHDLNSETLYQRQKKATDESIRRHIGRERTASWLNRRREAKLRINFNKAIKKSRLIRKNSKLSSINTLKRDLEQSKNSFLICNKKKTKLIHYLSKRT